MGPLLSMLNFTSPFQIISKWLRSHSDCMLMCLGLCEDDVEHISGVRPGFLQLSRCTLPHYAGEKLHHIRKEVNQTLQKGQMTALTPGSSNREAPCGIPSILPASILSVHTGDLQKVSSKTKLHPSPCLLQPGKSYYGGSPNGMGFAKW